MFPINPELSPIFMDVKRKIPDIMFFGPNEVQYISDEEWQNLETAIQEQEGMDYYPAEALKKRASDGYAVVPVVEGDAGFKIIGYQSREPLLRKAIGYLASKEVFNIPIPNFYKSHINDPWRSPIDVAEYMTGYVDPDFQDKGINSLSKWMSREQLIASGKEMEPTISVGVASNAVSVHVNSKMGLRVTDPNQFPLTAEFTTMLALPYGHGNRLDVLPHHWASNKQTQNLLKVLDMGRIPNNLKLFDGYFFLVSDRDKPFVKHLELSLRRAMLTVKSRRANFLKNYASEVMSSVGIDIERHYHQRFAFDIKKGYVPENIIGMLLTAVGGLKIYAKEMYDPSLENSK